MKKIVITALCICTAIAGHAIKTKRMTSGRPIQYSLNDMVGPHYGAVSSGHLADMLEKAARSTEHRRSMQNLPALAQKSFAREILNTTLPGRKILNTQRSLPRPSYRNPNTEGPFGRETVFNQGMQLVQELSHDLEQFTGEKPPFEPTSLVDLTKYNELAAQMQQLFHEENQIKNNYQHMTAYEEARPIRAAQEELAQQMTQELEKQTGYKDLSVNRGYVPPIETFTKLNGVVQRIQEQQKMASENEPSPLSTLSEAERIIYAKNRALQIIHFQEQLRHYILQMHPSWAEHMLQLDGTLSWYKYFYSTLAGVSIPVLHNYIESVWPKETTIRGSGNVLTRGVYGLFKSNWADIEIRALRDVDPFVSPDSTFKGLPSQRSATLAANVLAKTKGQTAEAADIFTRSPESARRGIRQEIMTKFEEVGQQVFPLIEQMRAELEGLSGQERALAPSVAEERLDAIIKAQTALRTFAAKYVYEEGKARILINLDATLSWYRYFYATSAGLFSDIPGPYLIKLSEPAETRSFKYRTPIIDKWKQWYEAGKPVVPQEEVGQVFLPKKTYIPVQRPVDKVSKSVVSARNVLDNTEEPTTQIKAMHENVGNPFADTVYVTLRNQYTMIYDFGLDLIQEMSEELKLIAKEEKTLSKEEITDRLEDIVTTQADLRAYAGEHLLPVQSQAKMLVKLDTILCWFRNFYGKRIGYTSKKPRKYDLSQQEIEALLELWNRRLQADEKPIPHDEIGLPKHFDQFMKANRIGKDPIYGHLKLFH